LCRFLGTSVMLSFGVITRHHLGAQMYSRMHFEFYS
jgi:hypothetical protein